MAQNTELFDELVEKDKVVEEAWVKPAHSVMAEIGKRVFDVASGCQPKRGRDNYNSGRGPRHGSRPSKSKQQSNDVTSTGGLTRVLDGYFVIIVIIGILKSVISLLVATISVVRRNIF